MNILLWIIQILLALLFLMAGVTKFIMSYADMTKEAPVVLPYWFILLSRSAVLLNLSICRRVIRWQICCWLCAMLPLRFSDESPTAPSTPPTTSPDPGQACVTKLEGSLMRVRLFEMVMPEKLMLMTLAIICW